MADIKEIKTISDRIADVFHPEQIILFGYHIYGNPSEFSDVDLLVIMPFEGKSFNKSLEILNKVKPRFALDLIVRTPEDFRWRVEQNDFFLRDILEKGKILYETPH